MYSEIVDAVAEGRIKNKQELKRAKSKFAKLSGMSSIPSNADILSEAGNKREAVLKILQTKPTRSLSGVAVVAVMTPPTFCAHGTCIFCPGGPSVNTPQSYTGHEPSTMRAQMFNFDSRKIAERRVEQLEITGHATDKIEVIIQGGTFTSQPQAFQYNFVKGIYDGLNGVIAKDLEEAKKINETTQHRCIGLTIETKPDWCMEKEINGILDFGCTRIELGVQNPDDEIYIATNRGHTVADVKKSTQLLKDSAYKVLYHLMPGLPGSNQKRDVEMFKQIFDDSSFRPDMLKIYPTLLTKPEFGQTELYQLYKSGEWVPYNDEEAADVIARAKQHIPKYVRIMRVDRDIPTKVIEAGPMHTNLREIALERAKELGIKCQCIRCREIGHRINKEKIESSDNIELLRMDYEASGGKEIFLSVEDLDNDALIGFSRLRIPNKPFRSEIDNKTALIRELHVYSKSLAIGKAPTTEWQHRGYGKQLISEAEKIAREEFDANKLLIISGVGVREYYRKLGYSNDGPYVSKIIG